ncbi:MAG TPA: P-loop NTPase fold protein [Solirubrobacteraceae bacterium]|jgi:TPR repeat protein|nr:P-loop NTPase fold protein [Solirubrobacteraceae bacterium]
MAESKQKFERISDEEREQNRRAALDRGEPEAAVRLGDFLIETGRSDEAQAVYRDGIARGDPDAAVRLGDLLLSRSDVTGAIENYRVGLERGDAEAGVKLGRLMQAQQNQEAAEHAYREALRRGDPEAGVLLGDLLRDAGRIDEARSVYSEGVSRGDPEAGARLDALASQAQPPPPPQTSPSDDAPPSPPMAPQPPPEEFDFVSSAAADLPTKDDLLGFAAVVEALHSLLDDKLTALPLALAITAPWGSGKSSVMWQLRERLTNPPPGTDTHRSWYTVKFDAWKYENSERLWAALAKAIYDQPQEDMGFVERLWFRVRLEYRRLALWKFLLKFLWPALLAAGAVVVALNVDLTKAGAGAAGLATVAAICALVARYWTAIVNPFKQAMERYASAPDYEAHLGFTAEADRDIQALTELLCPSGGKRGLAIFVDDLDRCSSTHVVEVVEAMNQIFNSDARSGCVFVLGLDREVVATNINVAYKDTVAALKEAKSPVGDDFGFHFLAKLVQMSVAIPPPQKEKLHGLLSSITKNGGAPGATAAPVVPEAEVQAASQAIAGEQAPDLASVGQQVAPQPAGVSAEAVKEATRRTRARRIRDSSEVVAAEFNGLEYLDRNPRQVKRFHNAFRLQLYVANADPRLQFDFSGDQLIALSRWVALRVRWPGLAQDIDQEPELLAELERNANDLPLSDEALRQQYRWFDRDEVANVLREPEDSRRINALPFQDFLQVA